MRKIILTNQQSPGDVLMLTAAVRDLYAAHHDTVQVDVRTLYPALWENNPYLAPLDEADPEVETFQAEYPLVHQSNQLPYHFIHGFRKDLEAKLGVTIPAGPFRGDIHLSDQEKAWMSQVAEGGYTGPFWLLVAGGKTDFTAKWWSPTFYQRVVDRLRGKVKFVQVGAAGDWHPPLEHVINLVGQTDLRQLVRLVYHAQGVVCPTTLAMHLAAAVPPKANHFRPCVVIAGGREPSHWEAYPNHQFLHNTGSLPCNVQGGCWRGRCQTVGDGDPKDAPDKICPTPVDVAADLKIPKCMFLVKPRDVIQAVRSYYGGGVLAERVELEGAREINFLGMRRSGNHPVMNWIVSQVDGGVAFFNNIIRNQVAPDALTSRLPTLRAKYRVDDLRKVKHGLVLYSWEDVSPAEAVRMENVVSDAYRKVILLRDAFNHLASTAAMESKPNHWGLLYRPNETGDPRPDAVAAWAARWKEYAREFLRIESAGGPGEVAVNYNKWVEDAAYREALFAALGLDVRTDKALPQVPANGGGSSFDGRALDGQATAGRYLTRWQKYADVAWFKAAFKNDPELVALSEQIFGHVEGTEVLTA